MTDWTHTLCDDCWYAAEPGRDPVRVKLQPIEVCCNCGALTNSGIYYREKPDLMSYCDHEQGKVKSLFNTIELLNAHVENLIDRVSELETGQPNNDD
jgi:hypothetical protein